MKKKNRRSLLTVLNILLCTLFSYYSFTFQSLIEKAFGPFGLKDFELAKLFLLPAVNLLLIALNFALVLILWNPKRGKTSSLPSENSALIFAGVFFCLLLSFLTGPTLFFLQFATALAGELLK